MSVVALVRAEEASPALAVGDRFELTREAGPKLRPKGIRSGRILADCEDSWRVRFDGTTTYRTIRKEFIQPERRR